MNPQFKSRYQVTLVTDSLPDGFTKYTETSDLSTFVKCFPCLRLPT